MMTTIKNITVLLIILYHGFNGKRIIIVDARYLFMHYGTLADPTGEGDILKELCYAKDAGFDFVEISVEGPKYTLPRLRPLIGEIKRKGDELGLFFTCHTPWGWNVGNPYKGIRDATVNEVIGVIGLAEELEARLVTVHMHTRFGLYDKKDMIGYMAEGLGALCDRAEKSGIAITVENVDQGVDEFKRLFELEPRARFHLDVGHANVSCKGGASILEFIEAFRDRLYHVHVHDNKGGHGVSGDLHLALGMGNIDWHRVVKALKDAGYDKTVTLEVFTKNRLYLEASLDIFKSLVRG
jgi:sugar phosphate isomerase/epimerase